MRRRVILTLLVALAIICTIVATSRGRNLIWAAYTRIRGRHTVDQRLEQYGNAARHRLIQVFERAQISYPPNTVGLLVLKDQRRLEVYAGSDEGNLRFICNYAIQGQSGELGPKLHEGDQQVPEGRYEIESLNPNSRFHLALRLNYPNGFDKRMGRQDGRTQLGSDIMIHGGTTSIGCLAMGDKVAEDLFVLVADTRRSNTFVVIAPVDFRFKNDWVAPNDLPKWATDFYSKLRIEMQAFPLQNGPQ